LEDFVGEAADLAAEGLGDVVEAFVEVGGGGFDVFVEFASVFAAPGVEVLEFFVEGFGEMAFELAKCILGGGTLHDDLEACDAGFDFADVGVERRASAEESAGVIGDTEKEGDEAE